MPSKKTTNESSFEKTVDTAKEATVKAAEKVGEKSKKVVWKIATRWESATTEDKIFRILWAILLLIWLIVLWDMVIGLILILLWAALVTGFFYKDK